MPKIEGTFPLIIDGCDVILWGRPLPSWVAARITRQDLPYWAISTELFLPIAHRIAMSKNRWRCVMVHGKLTVFVPRLSSFADVVYRCGPLAQDCERSVATISLVLLFRISIQPEPAITMNSTARQISALRSIEPVAVGTPATDEIPELIALVNMLAAER